MRSSNSPYLFSDPHVLELDGEVLADPGLVQVMNPHKANGELHQMHDAELYARVALPETGSNPDPTITSDLGKDASIGAGGAEWRRAASRVRRSGVI